MRIANLLDVTTTELPIWTVEQLTAVCLGPYQRDLAPGYASDYRYKDTVRAQGPGGGGTYQDPAHLHAAASQMPTDIPCYIFEQNREPVSWDRARFGPWERCSHRLLHVLYEACLHVCRIISLHVSH